MAPATVTRYLHRLREGAAGARIVADELDKVVEDITKIDARNKAETERFKAKYYQLDPADQRMIDDMIRSSIAERTADHPDGVA